MDTSLRYRNNDVNRVPHLHKSVLISINYNDSFHSSLIAIEHGQRNMCGRKKCSKYLTFTLPILIKEIVYFAHAQW